MGNKNIMEKMIKKILSWYSGRDVLTYEKDRSNPKWKFEQSFVEKFIKENLDISSIIDAPIGTNRFGNFIDNCSHVNSLMGIDFSDDMLKFSNSKKTKKLTLKKIDLIHQKIEQKADLVLIIRMLNLFETKISLNILDKMLKSAKKYCLITLRYDDQYSVIENKIHIQPLKKFLKKISDNSFNYNIKIFDDMRDGNFGIISMKKK